MGIPDITEALRNLFSSKRIVASPDEAPYDSMYGKNIKLENARAEFRKIKEQEELKFLQEEITRYKKTERTKMWTDNGGLFPSAKLPERNMISQRRLMQKRGNAISTETNIVGSGGLI